MMTPTVVSRPPGQGGKTLLAQAADFVAFSVIQARGLAYLLIRHRLRGYEIAGTADLLLIICSLAGALLLGLRRPGLLMKILDSVQRGANGLAKRSTSRLFYTTAGLARSASDL